MVKKRGVLLVIIVLCMIITACSKKMEEMEIDEIGLKEEMKTKVEEEGELTPQQGDLVNKKLDEGSKTVNEKMDTLNIGLIKKFATNNPILDINKVLLPINELEENESLFQVGILDLVSGQVDPIILDGEKNNSYGAYRLQTLNVPIRKINLMYSGSLWLVDVDMEEYYKVNNGSIRDVTFMDHGLIYEMDGSEEIIGGIYYLSFETLEEKLLIEDASIEDIMFEKEKIYLFTEKTQFNKDQGRWTLINRIIYSYDVVTSELNKLYEMDIKDQSTQRQPWISLVDIKTNYLILHSYNPDTHNSQNIKVNTASGQWKSYPSQLLKEMYGSSITIGNTKLLINNLYGTIEFYTMNDDDDLTLLKTMKLDLKNYFTYNNELYLIERCGQVLRLDNQLNIDKVVVPKPMNDNPIILTEPHQGIVSNQNLLKHDKEFIFYNPSRGRYDLIKYEVLDDGTRILFIDQFAEEGCQLPENNLKVLTVANRFESVDERHEVINIIGQPYMDMDYNNEIIAYSTEDRKLMVFDRKTKINKTIESIYAVNITIEGNNIYYADVEQGKLFYYNNGSTYQVTDDYIYRYEVVGGYVYYTDYLTRQLYRVKINKQDSKLRISDEAVERLIKDNETIYYVSSVDGVNFYINKIANHKKNQLIYIMDGSFFYLSDDFCFIDEGYLYYGYYSPNRNCLYIKEIAIDEVSQSVIPKYETHDDDSISSDD